MMTTTTTATPATEAAAAAIPVESHLPLVRKVAKKIARRLPSVVDVEDLVGAGTIGLLDAARRFDPARCQSFPAYAEIRIRGAILDQLRAMDWLPRSARSRSRRVGDAEQKLRRDFGRAPDASEVAHHLGVSLKSVTATTASVVSVEDVRADGFDSFEDRGHDPREPLESRERKEQLVRAIAALPLRSQQVLSLYYVEELTLKQIGAIFHITESRACQIHGQAVAKLRTALLDDVDLA